MDTAALNKTTPPWLHVCPCPLAEFEDSLREWESPGKRVVRILRGRKCVTKADFFNEAAAALQFHSYFGENWDAFADCLRDSLAGFEKCAIAIGITDAEKLLANDATSAATLAEILSDALQDVNAMPKPGKPRPFNVLLQCPASKAAALTKRWQQGR